MLTSIPRQLYWTFAFLLFCSARANGQATAPFDGVSTSIPELKASEAIRQAIRPVGLPFGGDAIDLGAQLAIATLPFGVSSGGFQVTLNSSTGLQTRTATTFGPSFAERAITSGEGVITAGASIMASSFDRLGSDAFGGLKLRSLTAPAAKDARLSQSNLTLTSTSVVISARMGITDSLDAGVSVPITSVKVGGSTSMVDGAGNYLVYASATGASKGLGDVLGLAKFRFYSFGSGQPDPGGLAAMISLRLPTGSRDELRGLGVTRTQVSLIASSGRGRFRPHANAGYEFWSKGVTIGSDSAPGATVTAKNQFQYAAGFEYEAAPRASVSVDLHGGQIYGAGKIGYATGTSGTSSTQSIVALPEGITRATLVPGVKVNLKGKLLLTVSSLIALKDTGLHARFTTVAGLDVTF